MELTAKIIRVGTYHQASTFTAPDGRVLQVMPNFDALGQFSDGDIAKLVMRGLEPNTKISAGMQATVNVDSITKSNGIWVIKGNTALNK